MDKERRKSILYGINKALDLESAFAKGIKIGFAVIGQYISNIKSPSDRFNTVQELAVIKVLSLLKLTEKYSASHSEEYVNTIENGLDYIWEEFACVVNNHNLETNVWLDSLTAIHHACKIFYNGFYYAWEDTVYMLDGSDTISEFKNQVGASLSKLETENKSLEAGCDGIHYNSGYSKLLNVAATL